VALLVVESIEVGLRGSRLLGVVGETMAETLMFVVDGETRAWGTMFDAMGEGVLSCEDD